MGSADFRYVRFLEIDQMKNVSYIGTVISEQNIQMVNQQRTCGSDSDSLEGMSHEFMNIVDKYLFIQNEKSLNFRIIYLFHRVNFPISIGADAWHKQFIVIF